MSPVTGIECPFWGNDVRRAGLPASHASHGRNPGSGATCGCARAADHVRDGTRFIFASAECRAQSHRWGVVAGVRGQHLWEVCKVSGDPGILRAGSGPEARVLLPGQDGEALSCSKWIADARCRALWLLSSQAEEQAQSGVLHAKQLKVKFERVRKRARVELVLEYGLVNRWRGSLGDRQILDPLYSES